MDKLQELCKSITEELEKVKKGPSPVPLHESHAPLIAHHVERLTGQKVNVSNHNAGKPGGFSGLHVVFPKGHLDDHTHHIAGALKHLGISHGGTTQNIHNDDEDQNEHHIAPHPHNATS
jgi:hypothetical protein